MTFVTRAGVLCIAFSSMGGCTVAELQQEKREQEIRIHEKEGMLQDSEARRNTLALEQQRLLKDISTKQMSLDELQVRLSQLSAENQRMVATTQQQREKKRLLDEQIAKQQRDVKQLRDRGDLSAEEKKRRIEALNREIRQQLELQLR